MKRGSAFIVLALAGPVHHDDIISLMVFEPTKVQIWNYLTLILILVLLYACIGLFDFCSNLLWATLVQDFALAKSFRK